MSRIAIPTQDEAPAETQPILDAVQKQLGFTPNIHRLLSISPAALRGFVGLQRPLSTTLDIQTRDAIALAVSEADGCDYCVAAHSYVAANFAKMSPTEIAFNREGRSTDPKRGAAAHLAKMLIETRGKVSDAEMAAIREAGFRDSEIVEIAALTAQFLLTNFVNNVAQTEIDFPAIEAERHATRASWMGAAAMTRFENEGD
jgi:uncharacterized peroxidase-related enzyme